MTSITARIEQDKQERFSKEKLERLGTNSGSPKKNFKEEREAVK
jgi:hypothetical protein